MSRASCARRRPSFGALVLLALLIPVLLPRLARAGESAEAIYPMDGVSQVSMSPGGNWIAATLWMRGAWFVVVQHVGLPTQRRIVESKERFWIDWEGPDTLIVETVSARGVRTVRVEQLVLQGDYIDARPRRISTKYGVLVDPLPRAPEEVLWAFWTGSSTSLHRVTIDDLVEFQKRLKRDFLGVDLGERIAVESGHVTNWIVDRDGAPRAALRWGQESISLLVSDRAGSSLRTVHDWRPTIRGGEVRPVGLTKDGRTVLVLAYADHDTLGLHEWDHEAKRVGREIFVHPDYDVSNVVIDPTTGDLVAVEYERDGRPELHYMDEYRARFDSVLPKEWRDRSVRVTSGTADHETFTFVDFSDSNPGDFYVRERGGRIVRVGRHGENVDRARLSPVEVVRVRSEGGVEIEAFLTKPRTAGRTPLLVLPHGGPSARDNRRFDVFAQYFASWGIAVLQVNYRGSLGYGKTFEALVERQQGSGIEDDIDAAVDEVVKRSDIDGSRICIFGWSYGGYSALASVVRHRDRYRCAISVNGVSDWLHLFVTGDVTDHELGRKFWVRDFGDPERDRELLIRTSPAYHVDRIETPILVVYGTEDRRVDPDQAHRMLMMLELHGKPHEVLEVEEGEHGFGPDADIAVMRASRRFLSRHLFPDRPFSPDPAISD
ncbi:MAG: prolyl oligopeptidase family serine peptidase [Myxococcota bacterium]